MTVKLNLEPDVEAGLLAQAQAAGLTLDQFLSQELRSRSLNAPIQSQLRVPLPGEADQWEQEFDAWLDSFPQHPVLSDDALKRENWYPDRW